MDDNLENAVIYAGFDDDGNSTTSNITMTFAPKVFQNKTNLRSISFHANEGQTSNASMAMMITIPDSAFVGCTNLTELNLLLKDNEKGTRALGPENFVLAGDSIFAGLDSLRFHILIDESRKQDFLDNESWAPLARFFKYGTAKPEVQYREYGASYAYAYEQNSIKKENKVSGHLIEHTIVTGMDSTDYYGFAQLHQGAVKLCNDIGTYNNYQLDYVQRKAFYGNPMLRTVSFTDLYGAGGIGDSYSSLDITLQDSCFAYCPNLVNIDLVYMKTDGTNKLVPLTPQQVKAGKGILDGTTAKIKMLPEQVAWFEADTTWNVYRDRFIPCIMRKTDEEVYNRLKDMRYYDPAATGTDDDLWDDFIDLARIAGVGRNTTKYTRDLLQNLEGLDELVFLTDQFASSESSDPWEADIDVVYVRQSQLADYMSDPALTRRTQNVTSVFEDDAVLKALADKEHYFPSEYLELESVEGIFTGNTDITSFNEFQYFQNVKTLEDGVFRGCTKMERITLPDSIQYIGSGVFRQCYQLSDIYISADSVPEIAADAFDFQVNWFPHDFRIYVPKDLCKRYREAWPQYAQYINVDTRRYTDDDIITVTVTEANTLAQALGLTITTDKRADGQQYISSARGDYSQYKRLKVVGPISGADLSILRYLAGYCPWSNTRNYIGKLEYLDLYDANLVKSDWTVATDA